MKLVAIFATTEKGQFGVDGGLPWGRSAPDDLQFFKTMTMGHVMIMGYNTYPSVQNLQHRDKIVITSHADKIIHSNAATYFVSSMEEAIKKAESLGHREAYIIGGARVLRDNAHIVDEIVWSRIPGDYPADIYLDVEKITLGRVLHATTTLPDGTRVHHFGELSRGVLKQH